MDGNQENHLFYRKKCVDYIKANRGEYQCIFENAEELEEYIRMMEGPRAWGGEMEMSIFSKLYKCAFIIHANGRPEITVSMRLSQLDAGGQL